MAEAPQESPLQAAKRALDRNDLDAAKNHIRQALLASPKDRNTLELAAEIALAERDTEAAIGWMIEAERQRQFTNESFVKRCSMELLASGKVYETIELLEEVLEHQPDQSETRRNLVYFLINAEQHRRAKHHGEILIRQRAFDKTTLFWMATYEQRDTSPSSMNAWSKLNPSDRRLEIAKLRVLFDNGQWDQFAVTADQILSAAPDFVPAQLLLGQSFVQTQQFDRLAEWAREVPEEARQHWQYWEVLGDWAMHSKQYPQAARAFFEASRRDVMIDSAATKLARSLSLCDLDSIDPKLVQITGDRGKLLNRFLQEKERYHKSHRRSNAAIAEMAGTLMQLGRPWEAEAWTAVGLTEPDEDVEKINEVRGRIFAELKTDPPLQIEDGHPFVSLDLTSLPLPEASALAQSAAPKQQTLTIVPSADPQLVEVSRQRGLIDAPQDPVTVAGGIIPLFAQLGFGGAAIDFDSDGWTDIYLASCGKEPLSEEDGNGQLFRNVGGHFVPVGDLARVEDRGFAQGVAAGDINEDGFVDLVLLSYGRDQVFLNNGDGTYSEEVDWIKDVDGSWSTSGAIADIDLDGIADFVCLKYCEARAPLERRCIVPSTNMIEYCVPTDFDAQPDQFFQGQPGGGWKNVNQRWNANPTTPGRGLGVVVGQLDDAPGIDTFIANDMTSNHYWSARPGDSFGLEETATIRGLALDGRSRPQASMGIATGDLDVDADTDFLVTNFEYEPNTIYEQHHAGIWRDGTPPPVIESSFHPLGFGVQAVDFDNDAQLELAIANGHVHHNAESGYAQRPQVLRRSTSGELETVSAERLTEYFRGQHVGRAMWSLDFDRDHRLDLVVTHQRESTALLHNQTPDAETNHWLRLRLVGTQASRDCVGSVVSVSCGTIHRRAIVVSGEGYFCSGEDTLHFGLGPQLSSSDLDIKITWPDGTSDSYQAGVDQECLIVEGQDGVYTLPGGATKSRD